MMDEAADPFGSVGGMNYGDLLAALRIDLQLNPATDLLLGGPMPLMQLQSSEKLQTTTGSGTLSAVASSGGPVDILIVDGIFAASIVAFLACINPISNSNTPMYSVVDRAAKGGRIRLLSNPVTQDIDYGWVAVGSD